MTPTQVNKKVTQLLRKAEKVVGLNDNKEFQAYVDLAREYRYLMVDNSDIEVLR